MMIKHNATVSYIHAGEVNVLRVIKIVVCLVVCMVMFAGTHAHARDVFSATFPADSVELDGILERIGTNNTEIVIDLPPDAMGNVGKMAIVAQNFTPQYRWVIFSLSNKDLVPQDLVVATEWQSFVGSGLFWPRLGKQKILSIQASQGLQPVKLEQNASDAYAFRINPGETITYAIEVSEAGNYNLVLWKRAPYASHRQDLSTFQGLLLGFALLISIVLIWLFVIMPQWPFMAAALFAWPAATFLVLDFGYYGLLDALFPSVLNVVDKAKAISEALMSVGLLACLVTFCELRGRMLLMAIIVMIAMLTGLGVALWGWFRPDIVAGVARISFAVVCLVATLQSLMFTRRRARHAGASLFFFVAVLLWTSIAAIAVFGSSYRGNYHFLVPSALVLVLGVMVLVTARFAFSKTAINSRFFEDSGRRALALVGSEQSVWDWREDANALYVGPELERMLALPEGKLTRGGLKTWLSLIHPDDRAGYVSAVETAVRRGRGLFTQQFRLRRADNSYRWFELKARAMPDGGGRAVRCIGALTDVTSSKSAEENLMLNAVRDQVTKLPNRTIFIDRLNVAMRRAGGKEQGSLHVLVTGLNNFKAINGGLGRTAGDHILVTVASRLKEIAEPEDTIARISGDMFAMIININPTVRSVEDFADAIRAQLSSPVQIDDREIFLTASVGIAPFRAEAQFAENLLKEAEIALYEAMRNGKNGVRLFDLSMNDEQPGLIQLESELHRAIERNEMEVLYQPITRLEDEELAGFEALIRWRHPQRGLLMPEEFIAIAEENGLIASLGEFVLNEAVRQLGIWQRAFRLKESLFVSINVSHSQLLGSKLVAEVQEMLAREDLVPGTLNLEITESMVMQNLALSIDVLKRLKGLGVSLACDDFGAGYSSLATLQRLPFDVLKLDKSLLDATPDDEVAETILQSIMDLAAKLQMVVIAEGVEKKAQAELLAEMGCDMAQGYYYGEPMTSRRVIDVLGGSPLLEPYQGPEAGNLSRQVFVDEEKLAAPVQIAAPAYTGSAVTPPPRLAKAVAAAPAAVRAVNGIPPPLLSAARQCEKAGMEQLEEQGERLTGADEGGKPSAENNADDMVLPRPQISSLQNRTVSSPASDFGPAKVPEFPEIRPEFREEDDLSLISGVGPAIRKDLRIIGIRTFRQLVDLTDEEVWNLNARMGLPNRVEREEWREQAADLMAGKPPRALADQEALKRKLMGQARELEPAKDEGASEEDDLGLISGIGPVITKYLKDYGIFSFRQILALSDSQAAEVEKIIGFPGRVKREEWREQAGELLAGKPARAKADCKRADAVSEAALSNPSAIAPEAGDDDLTMIKRIGPACPAN